jgi:hypothetical protein
MNLFSAKENEWKKHKKKLNDRTNQDFNPRFCILSFKKKETRSTATKTTIINFIITSLIALKNIQLSNRKHKTTHKTFIVKFCLFKYK